MIFFIICILLFFFCIKALRKQSLNAQKMKKELLPRGKPIQQKEPPQPKEKPITTTVKISRYDYDDIETMVAEGEEVSALNRADTSTIPFTKCVEQTKPQTGRIPVPTPPKIKTRQSNLPRPTDFFLRSRPLLSRIRRTNPRTHISFSR